MEMLLLNAFLEEDFGHELQQMFSIFSNDLHKFKLETQLKTLTHIVNEKQIGIKDGITNYFVINPFERVKCISKAVSI